MVLAILLGSSYYLIRIPAVQTRVTQWVAAELGERLNTKVVVEAVDIEFFKKLVLEGLYIEDLHKDTLLYTNKLKADISLFGIGDQKLDISSLEIIDSKFQLKRYPQEEKYNLAFIIDAFSSEDTSKSKPWDIQVRNIALRNVSFIHLDSRQASPVNGINFNDLRADHITGDLNNIRIAGDSIFTNIHTLSLIEKSGFQLREFTGEGKISPVDLIANNFLIRTNNSTLAGDLTFRYKEFADYRDFINEVSMDVEFEDSEVEMADIAYFAPKLNGIQKRVRLSGKVKGKVSNLKARKFNLQFGNESLLSGDIELIGLPHFEETFILCNIKQLNTNATDLAGIPVPPFDQQLHLDVPAKVRELGNISFSGDFTGFYYDFVAYGKFGTTLGNLATDISLKRDADQNRFAYSGKLKSSSFDIGKILDAEKYLGNISLNAGIKGQSIGRNIQAELKGAINSIVFNGYNYTGIKINGLLDQKKFSGKLTLADKNAKLNFDGKVDFNGAVPEFNFIAAVDSVNLGRLKIVPEDTLSRLGGKMVMNFQGNSIDNLEGDMVINGIVYQRNNREYSWDTLEVHATNKKSGRSLSLGSSVANVNVNGQFTYAELFLSLNNFLSDYFPTYFTEKKETGKRSAQRFDFVVNVKQTSDFFKVIFPPMEVSPGATISGRYDSENSHVKINGQADYLEYGGYRLRNWDLEVENDKDRIKLNTGGTRLVVNKQYGINDFRVSAISRPDTIFCNFLWEEKDSVLYKGDVNGYISFANAPKIELKLLPSELVVADSKWTIGEENKVIFDTSGTSINQLIFAHDDQFLKLDGRISKKPTDRLNVGFSNFGLSNIHFVITRSGVDIDGIVNGNVSVSHLYSIPRLKSRLTVDGFGINGQKLGDAAISSQWVPEKKAIYLSSVISQSQERIFRLTGNYYPLQEEDNLDFNIDFQKVYLEVIEPYIKDFISEFRGAKAFGELTLKGSFKEPDFNGKIHFQRAGFKVNYLNERYRVDPEFDTVYVSKKALGVKNMIVYDSENHRSTVSGHVYHNNFKDFRFDLLLNMHNFIGLNTTLANNDSYYGKAYVTGWTKLTGDPANLVIDIVAKTNRNTKFYIPLEGTEEVGESNFIRFVSKKEDKKEEEYKVDLSGVTMNFNLEVTPDAEVQMIFDSKIGDIIKGRGSGNIRMHINTLGEFKIFGDYVIDEGDYLFTLQRVINKKFTISRGGVLKWTGDAYNADIDIEAVYKLRAPLYDLVQDTTGQYKKRVPVELKLIMTNKLLNPDITFDIDVTGADEFTRSKVKNSIRSDQEMNKQVFALLVLNRFLPPAEGVASSEYAALGAGGKANSSELLSNQLSNWISQISNDFDIGINYRPGDEITSEEVEVALSTQLFNDRVTVDGNVGYATDQNTSNIVGDFNVEYMITEDGKVRVKAFNRSNNTALVGSDNPYTQGVGLFYRKEFDNFEEVVDMKQLYLKLLTKVKFWEKSTSGE